MHELIDLDQNNYEQLAETFNNAFSDYVLPMNVSASGLQAMLYSRGYVPELSRGVTVSGKWAGFIFIGRREINGWPELYVCSMGVVPEQRQHGFASELLAAVKGILLQSGARQLVLEVITTNDKAVALYSKHGFIIERELVCLKIAKKQLRECADNAVETIALSSIPEECGDFFDFSPTWQNQRATIKRLPEKTIKAVQVSIEGRLRGFAIANCQTSSIMQLAVNKADRGRGTATALLAYLARETAGDSLSMVNVGFNQPLDGFLRKSGFSEFIRQYEMILRP